MATGLVVLLFTACGLPTIPFLAAPQNPRNSGANEETRRLLFDHNQNNDVDDFRGYELYYKLYEVSATAALQADENFISTTPVEPGPSRLQQRGFVRAAVVTVRDASNDPPTVSGTTGDDQPPTVPTDPTGALITYTIDLSQRPADGTSIDNADVIVAWTESGGRAIGIRRRSAQSATTPDFRDSFDSFWNAASYDSDDYDVQQMGLEDLVDSGPVDRLVTIWYALSYGIDGTSFSGYYSEPLRLDQAVIVTE